MRVAEFVANLFISSGAVGLLWYLAKADRRYMPVVLALMMVHKTRVSDLKQEAEGEQKEEAVAQEA